MWNLCRVVDCYIITQWHEQMCLCTSVYVHDMYACVRICLGLCECMHMHVVHMYAYGLCTIST